jgi:hypothetical protein
MPISKQRRLENSIWAPAAIVWMDGSTAMFFQVAA